MRRICSAVGVTLGLVALFFLLVDLLARQVIRAASTNFHSNGGNHEQHRKTTQPRGA